MIRTLASLLALALLSSASVAEAVWFFGPKKEQVACGVYTQHPGAGRGTTNLAPVALSNGAASISAVADIIVKGAVAMRGARIQGTVATDAKGTSWLSVAFRDSAGKVLKTDKTVIRRDTWSLVAFENWPKSQAYLGLQCLIQAAR